jgi:hypothetical protein
MEGSYSDYAGGPEHLLELAQQGRFSKELLAGFLAREKRQAYLDACAAIERRYTEECTAANDPCLEGGCAVEGEICLQPILRVEDEYLKAVGHEWAKLFIDPRNRSEAWQK